MNVVKTIGIGSFGAAVGLILLGVLIRDADIMRTGVIIMILGGLAAGVAHAMKEKK